MPASMCTQNTEPGGRPLAAVAEYCMIHGRNILTHKFQTRVARLLPLQLRSVCRLLSKRFARRLLTRSSKLRSRNTWRRCDFLSSLLRVIIRVVQPRLFNVNMKHAPWLHIIFGTEVQAPQLATQQCTVCACFCSVGHFPCSLGAYECRLFVHLLVAIHGVVWVYLAMCTMIVLLNRLVHADV